MGNEAYTDKEIIASVRKDAFEGIMKTVLLQHHRDLRNKIRPHFEAILNAIDGVESNAESE